MNEYNTSKTCSLSVDPMKPDESHEVATVNNCVKGCFSKMHSPKKYKRMLLCKEICKEDAAVNLKNDFDLEMDEEILSQSNSTNDTVNSFQAEECSSQSFDLETYLLTERKLK